MAKYVLEFSPEYFATSLWSRNKAADDAFGWGPVEYDKLPLSAELVRQLKKFDDHCVGIIDWSDPGKGDIRPQSEAEEYYLTGVKLMEMVRAELGDEFEITDGLNWIKPESLGGEPEPDTEYNPGG